MREGDGGGGRWEQFVVIHVCDPNCRKFPQLSVKFQIISVSQVPLLYNIRFIKMQILIAFHIITLMARARSVSLFLNNQIISLSLVTYQVSNPYLVAILQKVYTYVMTHIT